MFLVIIFLCCKAVVLIKTHPTEWKLMPQESLSVKTEKGVGGRSSRNVWNAKQDEEALYWGTGKYFNKMSNSQSTDEKNVKSSLTFIVHYHRKTKQKCKKEKKQLVWSKWKTFFKCSWALNDPLSSESWL